MEHTTEEAIRQSKARNKSFWDAMDRYNKGVEADKAAQKPAGPPPVDPPPGDPPKKQFSTWEDFKKIQQSTPSVTAALKGDNSYFTKAGMQNAFDELYNAHIGGKYTANTFNNGVNRVAVRRDPGYNKAWADFQSNYTLEGGKVFGRYILQTPEKLALEQRQADWLKNNPEPKMRGPLGGGVTQEWQNWSNAYLQAKATEFKKQGGTMNRINYFQQGGATPQQDIQKQIVALVQAAMQGDQKATQTVNQIMEAAKAGDQKAAQLAQMIQAVAQKMQGQATAAKWGAKLGYIRSLKYAKGGKTCPACQALEKGDKVEKKACGGKKAKKHYFGGWL